MEWDFTDLYYKNNPKYENVVPDSNIVIVNIGHLDREGISRLLDTVNTYQPKVVGFNVKFSKEKEVVSDSLLEMSFQRTKSLVLMGRLQKDTTNIEKDGFYISASHPRFTKHATTGMTALIFGIKNVVRGFFTYEEDVNKGKIDCFSFEILKHYDPILASTLIEEANVEEAIKYQGHMDKYIYLDFDEVGALRLYNLNSNNNGWDWVQSDYDLNHLKDKIVLFGFIGRATNTFSDYSEDIYLSPLKKEYLGLASPDMYGTVILANITSMLLNEDAPINIQYLAAPIGWFSIIVFLIILKFVNTKFKKHNQMIDRTLSMFGIFLLIYLNVKLFEHGVYVNLSLAVFLLLFAADANEFYLKIFVPISFNLTVNVKKIFVFTPIVIVFMDLVLWALYYSGTNMPSQISNIGVSIWAIYLFCFYIYGQILKRQLSK